MANIVGKPYNFVFVLAGVTGLLTASFPLVVFTCNGVNVSTAVSSSFAVKEVPINLIGDVVGFYEATYTPDTPGTHILGFITPAPAVPYAIDLVDILSADQSSALSYVNLTQDSPTPGALKPSGDDLQDSLLLVFNSSDWDVGRTDPLYAVAKTNLDSDGNWESASLTVTPGTYHIVLQNNYGYTEVIYPYLEVQLGGN